MNLRARCSCSWERFKIPRILKEVANTVKHFAFTRCGEFNLFGMVDAQIAVVEGELLANNTLVS